MNPYEIVMKNLREAGFNHDKLADSCRREDVEPIHVINVRRDQKSGKILFTRHTPGDTVVVFQGLQVNLERLTLLIDRENCSRLETMRFFEPTGCRQGGIARR
jgi:hypothetical protein